MIMQAAFFKLSKVMPLDDAIKYLKEGIEKTYKKKGQKIVDMNCAAVDRALLLSIRLKFLKNGLMFRTLRKNTKSFLNS